MTSPEAKEGAIPPAEEGPDPYARILQLQAQILQLQAQLLHTPTRPPAPSGSSPPGELHLSIHSLNASSQSAGEPRLSENGDALPPVPDFPKEDSPRRKRGNIATISFPEHRMIALTQAKSRIEMDTRARLQIGAVIVDGHVDVVVKALSSSALAAALKMIDTLTDDEEEFSTVTWSGKRATHSPTSSMFDMRTSTTIFDIPPGFLDPNSRAENLHVDPDSSTTNAEASPEISPAQDPRDSDFSVHALPHAIVGNQFIKAGPLNKKGSGLRSWQKRLFGLTSTSLLYFKPGESSAKSGIVLTPDSYVVAVNSTDKAHRGTEFVLYEGITKDNYFHLHASSESERKEWMTALQEQIDFIKSNTKCDGKFGELELYLWFDEERSTVHVSVLRARGLPMLMRGPTARKLLSPYVKLSINPEQKQRAKRKTAVAKNTQDPVWNSSFDFILDSALTSQTLVLSVMNKGTGKDNVIAKVEYPLLNVPCDQAEAQQGWLPLGSQEGGVRRVTNSNFDRMSLADLPIVMKRSERDLEPDKNDQVRKSSTSMMRPSEIVGGVMLPGAMLRTIVTNPSKQLEETSLEEDLGDLELCLWFQESASTLHVRVLRGRGIIVKGVDGKLQPTNALVKLEILPKLAKNSKKKTVIVHDNPDPVWNEEFEFVFDEVVTIQTLFVRVLNIDRKLLELGGLEIPLLNISDTSDAFPAWYSLLPTTTSFVPLPISTSSTAIGSSSSPSSPNHIDDKKGGFFTSPSSDPSAAQSDDPEHHVYKSGAIKRRERVSVAMIRKAFKSEHQELKDINKNAGTTIFEDLAKQPEDLGAIKLCVWYDAEAEKLLVEVLECVGLPPQKKSLPSPYVEVKTLPSELTGAVHRTKRQGKTLDPEFNEKFEFAIAKDKCAFRTLALSVFYASGRFGKDKVMGEVLIALEDIPRSIVGATQTHPLCQASSTVFELNHLGDILFLEAGFESFLASVTKEHSNENLLFWREVQDFHLKYRDATFDQRQECMADCCEIFYKYIDSGGDCEINISPAIKAQIRAELTEEKQSDDITRPCEYLAVIYDPAQTEVLDMMSKDSFARYLASKEWQQFKLFLREEFTERDIGFKVVNQIADFNQVGKNRTSVVGMRGAVGVAAGRRSSSLAQHRRLSNNPYSRSTTSDGVATFSTSNSDTAFANAGFVDESAASSSASASPSLPSSSLCCRQSASSLRTPPLPSSTLSLASSTDSPSTDVAPPVLRPASSVLRPSTSSLGLRASTSGSESAFLPTP